MKKIINICFALFCFLSNSFAQTQKPPATSLKIGLGTTFLKPANYLASNTLQLRLEQRLFKPISIYADGFRINGEQMKSDGNEHHSKGFQADGGLNLALFSSNSSALKIGGGATWQSMNNRFTTAIERDSNDQVVSKDFDETDTQNFGWSVSIEYEVYVAKHIILGTRFTYKKYDNNDQNYFFGLNAGFRF